MFKKIANLLENVTDWGLRMRNAMGGYVYEAGTYEWPYCTECGSLDIDYEFPVGYFGSERFTCNHCGSIDIGEVAMTIDADGNEVTREVLRKDIGRYSVFSMGDFL